MKRGKENGGSKGYKKEGERGKEEDRRDERERGLSKLKNHLHSYTTVVLLCNKLLTVCK